MGEKIIVPYMDFEDAIVELSETTRWNPTNLKKIKFFTRGLKMKKVQSVPIRKRGMTGSGRKEDCHSNVSKLVHTYGGYDVRGYYVVYNEPTKTFCFNPHSVWKTPEGKLVDVTLNWIDDDYISFIPVYECSPCKSYYFSQVQFFVFENKNVAVFISIDDDTTIKVSRKECKRGKVRLKDFWGYKENSYFEEHPEKLESDYVSFSKPSTSTGKYFEMRNVP